MIISMISAMAVNRVIGNNNNIPWHLPEDFDYFKAQTKGYPVIMGKNTYISLKHLPNNELPGRENIIITRNSIKGKLCFKNIKESLNYCQQQGYKKVFLIGGSGIYKEGLSYADEIHLTIINKVFKGDTFFPEIDDSIWKKHSTENHYSEQSKLEYSFNIFTKIS